MLPYRTRNLCTIGHRTTGGKHEATIGVLHFILEENGHLVNKRTDKPVRKTQSETTFWIYLIKQPVCMSYLLTLICMSWKKIKRVCRINWKSPLDMGAYICKINQCKSNDKAETWFESSWHSNGKKTMTHLTSSRKYRFVFFNYIVSQGKVAL